MEPIPILILIISLLQINDCFKDIFERLQSMQKTAAVD